MQKYAAHFTTQFCCEHRRKQEVDLTSEVCGPGAGEETQAISVD